MLSRDFFLFNTENHIEVETDDDTILDQVEALCQHYERMLSCFNPESELYRLNQQADKTTPISDELAEIIEAALFYCQATNGAFDITMGAVTRLWNLQDRIIPCRQDLAAALAHVDWEAITLRRSAGQRTITVADANARLDLGGIAKGYIADSVTRLLKQQGIMRAIINLGGNVAVLGEKQAGKPWHVGLRSPLPSSSMSTLTCFGVVEIADASAVTSGIYERAAEIEGVFYHHILDPTTGMPAETDILSATVIAPQSIDADGYTTALIVMGAKRALECIESIDGLEAIIVTTHGDVIGTSGIGETIPFALLQS